MNLLASVFLKVLCMERVAPRRSMKQSHILSRKFARHKKPFPTLGQVLSMFSETDWFAIWLERLVTENVTGIIIIEQYGCIGSVQALGECKISCKTLSYYL
jgi:hypothetical protein